ncbi:MAG: YwaF family protein [Clostridia bacterium]|nr:YwaF family protein [Clostridia bacterium]
MEWITELMAKTAIPMETPTAYGPFHLAFFIVGFAAVIFAAWKLRKLGDRRSRILLFSCGLFLALTEIYKQLFYTFYVGKGAYQWYVFPFQMCSVPMYFLLIGPFLKKGKIRRGMYQFMMVYSLLGGVAAYFEPSNMAYPYLLLTLHSFLWHLTLVFIGLYLGFSDNTGKRLRDFGYATVTLLILCLAAFLINLIFWVPAKGDINMFFVGPANTSLVILRDIARSAGWYVSTLVYIPAVLLGGCLIFLPFALADRKKRTPEKPDENAAGEGRT